MKEIKCINNEGFSLITVGKKYEIKNESRDFYYIINDAGVEKRYGKGRFEVVKEKEKKEPEPKPEKVVKPKGVVCVFPKGSEFRYKQTYYPMGVSADDSKYVFEIGGEKHEVLKSRFVPEK